MIIWHDKAGHKMLNIVQGPVLRKQLNTHVSVSCEGFINNRHMKLKIPCIVINNKCDFRVL